MANYADFFKTTTDEMPPPVAGGDAMKLPRLRSCSVQKARADEEYGFNLHAEKGKGQYIGHIDADSPADRAGLRSGDRIIAVNNHLVTGETHKEVVMRIKALPGYCHLLVVDDDGYRWYAENGRAFTLDMENIDRIEPRMVENAESIDPPSAKIEVVEPQQTSASEHQSEHAEDHAGHTHVDENELERRLVNAKVSNGESTTSSQPHEPNVIVTNGHVTSTKSMTSDVHQQHVTPKPLLCTLEKKAPTDEFGFNLHAERGRGHFIGKVDESSIAHRSGLVLAQRIVGVNGTLIFPTTPHEEVVALIRLSPLRTQLLVVSESVDEHFKKHDLSFSFDHADVYDDNEPPPVYVNKRHPSSTEEKITEMPPAYHHTSPSTAPDSTPPRSHGAPLAHSTPPINANDERQIRTFTQSSEDHSKGSSRDGQLSIESTELSDGSPSSAKHVNGVAKQLSNGHLNNNNSRVYGDGDPFQMSAAEMRARIAQRHRNVVPALTLEQKYHIVENM